MIFQTWRHPTGREAEEGTVLGELGISAWETTKCLLVPSAYVCFLFLLFPALRMYGCFVYTHVYRAYAYLVPKAAKGVRSLWNCSYR